jgi:Zn-dependent M16 (insulinase) family peptidase
MIEILLYFRQGFEQSQIDAILHQYEISIKHQDENFGLKVILVCLNDYFVGIIRI